VVRLNCAYGWYIARSQKVVKNGRLVGSLFVVGRPAGAGQLIERLVKIEKLDRDRWSQCSVSVFFAICLLIRRRWDQGGNENIVEPQQNSVKGGSLLGIVIPAGLDEASELRADNIVFEIRAGLYFFVGHGVVKVKNDRVDADVVTADGVSWALARFDGLAVGRVGFVEGVLERAHFVEDNPEGIDIDGSRVSLL